MRPLERGEMTDSGNEGYCIITLGGDGMGTISSERPPMDKDTGKHDQEGTQGDDKKNEVSTLKSGPSNSQQDERQPEKTKITQPEECRRVKKRCVWIKRNFFNLMLTIFTGLYAVGFMYDAYITKRAYLVPERYTDNSRAVSILPNDAGVRILFRNTGMTPAMNGIFQAWLLKEKEVVKVGEPDPHIVRQTVAAGRAISLTLSWPDAPRDIDHLRKKEIAVRIIARLRYSDVFAVSHCEEFATEYTNDPWAEFTETSAAPVCNSVTQSVRFNRVCVPSADRTFGVWIETLEAFDSRGPGSPAPENDPIPCQYNNQK
jgi:hypothetical protein